MKRPSSLRHSAIRAIFKRMGIQLDIKNVPINDNGQKWFHLYFHNGQILLSAYSKLSDQYTATDLMRKFKVV